LQRFAPGEALIAEGDRAAFVFLILGGSPVVTKRLGPREEAVLALRGGGGWVGELAHHEEGPRRTSIAALDAVEALVVLSSSFLAGVTCEPEVADDLVRVLTGRLRESDRAWIESLAAKTRSLEAENRELAHENRRLADELDARTGFEAFVGESAAA